MFISIFQFSSLCENPDNYNPNYSKISNKGNIFYSFPSNHTSIPANYNIFVLGEHEALVCEILLQHTGVSYHNTFISQVYIRDCTMVSVYPLLLFGGAISIDLDRGEFMLSVDDGWIRFMATSHMVR